MIEKQIPSLSSLLRISVTFEVPVLDWLVKSVDTTPRSFFNVRAAAPKRLLRRCDLSVVRTKLDTLIDAEDEFPPSSFAEICRRLGTEQSFAARKFPDHARILIERRKQYLSIKKQMGRQFTKLAVESTFNRLLSDGVRPTSTQMAKSLPKGIALRDRGARDEFNRLRRELAAEFQEIQTTIAAADASETPVRKNKMAAAVLDP
jgi:hypothetical protein